MKIVEGKSHMPFCPQCGKEVSIGDRFCRSCGASLSVPIPTPIPATPHPMKSPGVAAVLAAVAGALLFLGVGHIYVGRIGRGLALLVIGWVIYIPFIISLLFFWLIWPILITILLGIVIFALWAWSIYDAYNLAKQYNDHLQVYGKPPW